MRRHQFKGTTYGMKGGEGANKGKKLVRYEAQDPSGKFHVAGMMHEPATAPRTAYVRFLQSIDTLVDGKPAWKASGVRTEPHEEWGGVWVEGKRFG
jgi:hypothetical protein